MKKIGYIIAKTNNNIKIGFPYFKYIKKYNKIVIYIKKYIIKDYRKEGVLSDFILFDCTIIKIINI